MTAVLFTILILTSTAFAQEGEEIVVVAHKPCSFEYIKKDLSRRNPLTADKSAPPFRLMNFNSFNQKYTLVCPKTEPKCLGNYFMTDAAFVAVAYNRTKTQLSVTISGALGKFVETAKTPTEEEPAETQTHFESQGEHTKSFSIERENIRDAEKDPNLTIFCPPKSCTVYRFESNLRPPDVKDEGENTYSFHKRSQSAIVVRKVNGKTTTEMIVNAENITVSFENHKSQEYSLKRCGEKREEKSSKKKGRKVRGLR